MLQNHQTSLIRQPCGEGIQRIAIVKWEKFYSDTLRRCVENTIPSAKISVFRTASEMLATLRSEPAHLGLIELTLPDMDGLDLLAIICDERLIHRLLVVSDRSDERSRLALRFASINGIFDFNVESFDDLPKAIRCVADGGCYRNAHPRSAGLRGAACGARLDQLLSPEELEVFAVLGDGSSDEKAGEQLGICAETVHSKRKRIMRRLGVQSRTDLMVEAIRRGVVRVGQDRTLRPGFERDLAVRARRSTAAARAG